MKTAFCLALLWLLTYHPTMQPQQDGVYPGDRIVGQWETPAKEKVEIFKFAGRYYGKLVGGNRMLETDGTSKKDIHNPDPKLRSRSLQGLVVLMDFAFRSDFWDDGKIYDYDSGLTYRSNMNYKNGQLILHGYKNKNDLFGQTMMWNRAN